MLIIANDNVVHIRLHCFMKYKVKIMRPEMIKYFLQIVSIILATWICSAYSFDYNDWNIVEANDASGSFTYIHSNSKVVVNITKLGSSVDGALYKVAEETARQMHCELSDALDFGNKSGYFFKDCAEDLVVFIMINKNDLILVSGFATNENQKKDINDFIQNMANQ